MDYTKANPNVYNPNTNYAAATERAAGEAGAARKNLENYSRNIQDYGKLYEQNLGQAEQRYGFNPADLQKAQRALAVTNTTIANLPEAIRQAGNYYGTTTGGFTNAYQQAAGRLQGLLAGQSNMVNSYNAAVKASQDLANAQAGYTVMSEKQKQDALNQIIGYTIQQQELAQANQLAAGSYQTGLAGAQTARLSAEAEAALIAQQTEYARMQNAQLRKTLDELAKQGVYVPGTTGGNYLQPAGGSVSGSRGAGNVLQGGGAPSMTGNLAVTSGPAYTGNLNVAQNPYQQQVRALMPQLQYPTYNVSVQ